MTKLFTDSNGKLVVFQTPNPALWTWIITTLLNLLINNLRLSQLLGLIGKVAIVYWAIMEITSGVNYFRRIMGVIVFGITLWGTINN